MRLWTVHEPRDPASAEERADKTLFIRDGFVWLAFLFPLPWLLIHRLWFGTAVYLCLVALGVVLGLFVPITENAGFVVALVAHLYAGLEGNDLRRNKLARRGFSQVAAVVASKRMEAERIFFEGSTSGFEVVGSASAPVVRETRPASPYRGETSVLGLFPNPEASR